MPVKMARQYVTQKSINSTYFLEWTCPKSCSDAGICDTTRGTCFCDLGRSGQDCSSMKKKYLFNYNVHFSPINPILIVRVQLPW